MGHVDKRVGMKQALILGFILSAVMVVSVYLEQEPAVGGSADQGPATEIVFTKKAINLPKLTTEIQTAFEWTRATPGNAGFTGLTYADIGNNQARIYVVWTDNGEDGYRKELTPLEQAEIESLITLHNAL